jgi:ferredoxin-thioredoxin reductase catalytic subunit
MGEDIDSVYEKLKKEAEEGGYRLNPDVEFVKELIKGLLENERRYGYRACPCRLASGKKEDDLDIVCPCDYRDSDIAEFGGCYCGLYVSEACYKGESKLKSIPERRPPPSKRKIRLGEVSISHKGLVGISSLSLPIWRCKVCGYLCAREQPPEVCPICKVKKDRFERFL